MKQQQNRCTRRRIEMMQVEKIAVGCLQSLDASIMHLERTKKLAPHSLMVSAAQPPRWRKARAHGSSNLRNPEKRRYAKSAAILFGAKNKNSLRGSERAICFTGRAEAIRPEIRHWCTDRLKLGEISGSGAQTRQNVGRQLADEARR